MSPDGTWFAYVSNETGVNQVYIRRLQEVSPRWPVSQNRRMEPRWARSGEVFYRRGDSVYVSRVELGDEPRVGPSRALFAGDYIHLSSRTLTGLEYSLPLTLSFTT